MGRLLPAAPAGPAANNAKLVTTLTPTIVLCPPQPHRETAAQGLRHTRPYAGASRKNLSPGTDQTTPGLQILPAQGLEGGSGCRVPRVILTPYPHPRQ